MHYVHSEKLHTITPMSHCCLNPGRKLLTQLSWEQPKQSLSFKQKTGQFSVLASLADINVEGIADIDTVKAATTARTEEKRIVCEDVEEYEINLRGTVGRHLALYADY